MNRESVLRMNVDALRDKLREIGLDTQGLKTVLQARLLEHLGLDFVDATDENQATAGDDTASGQTPLRVFGREDSVTRSMYTLKDVQDSLSMFSGVGSPDVNQWITEFEEMAEIVEWSSLQKFVYGKQLLTGSSKAFIRGQTGISSWAKLRSILLEEFGSTLSTAQIHAQMRNRRLQRSETLLVYLYSLMEIGKKAEIDEKSIVEYFIEGVPDSKMNKMVLYEAENIGELKKRIQIYEKIRQNPQSSYKVRSSNSSEIPKAKLNHSEKPREGRKCFKCGDRTHFANNCPGGQYKCFKCRRFGHRSFECKGVEEATDRSTSAEKNQANMVQKGSSLIFKDVTIRGRSLSALIDTGCDICLMRFDTLFLLGEVNFVPERVVLQGIGECGIHTMGRFATPITIDGTDFDVTFYVVAERDINYSIMIGNSLLLRTEMIIKNGEVTIRKPTDMSALLNEFSSICLNTEGGRQDDVVELSHLSRDNFLKVEKMIAEYEPQKNVKSPIEMKLILKDDIPIHQRPRRLPYADQVIVDKQVSQWLDEKIVVPSTSEYASPVVLVSKKDGSKRLCCDYRKLNDKIVRDHFPMPLIDEVLDKLQNAKVYTTLDLANGFSMYP